MKDTILSDLACNLARKAFRNSRSIKNIGLFDGRMGLCINLFVLGNSHNDAAMIKMANTLFDRLLSEMISTKDISFINGLSGIGWGIEHLVQQRLISAETLRLLPVVDKAVWYHLSHNSVATVGVFNGPHGLVEYLIKRLSNPDIDPDGLDVLQLRFFVISAIDKITNQVLMGKFPYQEPNQLSLYWSLPCLLELLYRLSQLDVFNFRVHKTISAILSMNEQLIPESPFSCLQLANALALIHSLDICPDSDRLIDPLMMKLKSYSWTDYCNSSELDIRLILEMLFMLDLVEAQFGVVNNARTHLIEARDANLHSLPVKRSFQPDIVQSLGLLDGYGGFYRTVASFFPH